MNITGVSLPAPKDGVILILCSRITLMKTMIMYVMFVDIQNPLPRIQVTQSIHTNG